jgi:hypothetical protein
MVLLSLLLLFLLCGATAARMICSGNYARQSNLDAAVGDPSVERDRIEPGDLIRADEFRLQLDTVDLTAHDDPGFLRTDMFLLLLLIAAFGGGIATFCAAIEHGPLLAIFVMPFGSSLATAMAAGLIFLISPATDGGHACQEPSGA